MVQWSGEARPVRRDENMPDSELFEAADLIEQIGVMLKEDPKELVNLASGTSIQREATANYFLHLANMLRNEGINESQDGQG